MTSQQIFYDDYIESKEQEALSLHRGRVLLELLDSGPTSVLDVGCGNGEILEAVKRSRPGITTAVGMDMASSVADKLAKRGLQGVAGDLNAAWPFADATFDVVIAAEIIEHVFDTDLLVKEAFRVLAPGGSLVLTTPNLAYAANRLLLLAGIQPLFTETSTSQSLGRGLRMFGQGQRTQGHLKVFTAGALREILMLAGFEVEEFRGYRFIQSGLAGAIDHLLTVRPSLAAGLAVRARRPLETLP